MRWFLRSKIHKATVTEADLNYIGSITIDEDLVEKAGFLPGERVLVVSNTSGARLETYVIAGPRGSGIVTMNGKPMCIWYRYSSPFTILAYASFRLALPIRRLFTSVPNNAIPASYSSII